MGYGPGGYTELDTTEQLRHTSGLDSHGLGVRRAKLFRLCYHQVTFCLGLVFPESVSFLDDALDLTITFMVPFKL